MLYFASRRAFTSHCSTEIAVSIDFVSSVSPYLKKVLEHFSHTFLFYSCFSSFLLSNCWQIVSNYYGIGP